MALYLEEVKIVWCDSLTRDTNEYLCSAYELEMRAQTTSQCTLQVSVWPWTKHTLFLFSYRLLTQVCATVEGRNRQKRAGQDRCRRSLLTRLNLSFAGPVSASSLVLGFIFRMSPVVVPR